MSHESFMHGAFFLYNWVTPLGTGRHKFFFAAVASYTLKIASCTFLQNVKVQQIRNVILHFGLANPEAKKGCKKQLFGSGSNNHI